MNPSLNGIAFRAPHPDSAERIVTRDGVLVGWLSEFAPRRWRWAVAPQGEDEAVFSAETRDFWSALAALLTDAEDAGVLPAREVA